MMNSYMQLNQAAMQYSNAYRATGDDNALIAARSASDAADKLQAQMIGLANKHVLRDEFQKNLAFLLYLQMEIKNTLRRVTYKE